MSKEMKVRFTLTVPDSWNEEDVRKYLKERLPYIIDNVTEKRKR